MADLTISRIRCEYKLNPIGIDVKKPRFSWEMMSEKRGTKQTAYRLQVSLNASFTNPFYDSQFLESDQSVQVDYNGTELSSQTRYFYRVKIKDNYERESDWSTIHYFETAFFEREEWKATWITPNELEMDPNMEEAFYLRKPFELKKPVASARAYVTCLGLYELYLNGEKVGNDYLAPGWTSYNKRLQYQVYDITDNFQENQNSIGIVLANGWYKGNLAWEGKRNIYGNRRAALVQICLNYVDGTEEIIVSDSSWKASTGPIRYSEIYHGETFDARLIKEGWCSYSFDDSDWSSVSTLDLAFDHLIAQENDPVRVTEKIKPVRVLLTPNGDQVIDMGQNMVGRIRFEVEAPEGTEIVLKHAEILDKEGTIYFGNLRTAKQTIRYITNGKGKEEYAPFFTFQGFRYVKVEGYPGLELPVDKFVGEVMHTDMEEIGHFESSHPLVNQLQQNIRWGQRGNFVDVPTDCPQRDERLGWTGDAQVFIRTALFNYQGGPFFTKWLRDLKADQLDDGGVPFVIPNVLEGASSSAWGDASVICPWTVYMMYGDKRLLEEQFPSMKAWVDYIRKQGKNEYLWNTGFHFGDWLALDAKENSYFGATPNDLVSTAYYAYSTRILRDAAEVLNKVEEVRTYSKLLNKIKENFSNEFISPNGRMVAPTQTAHVLPLVFNLVDGDIKKRIAHDLNELVIESDYHLTTGFVGTPYICFALTQNGYHQTALKLLLQKTYPSWLYPITKGATTIWEHWDGIKLDGSFWSDDMNSFNHYAYGAIGDWLYRSVAGLDINEADPGFKSIRISPHLGNKELTKAKASFYSLYGKVVSGWEVDTETITVEIELPANTTAEVFLPFATYEHLIECNRGIAEIGEAPFTESEQGLLLELGSGSYKFIYPHHNRLLAKVTLETRLLELFDNEGQRNLLVKYLPILEDRNILSQLKKHKLSDLLDHSLFSLSENQIKKLIQELNDSLNKGEESIVVE
ncbi:family 78 glycoside hydrolase catalytic domain [Pullulanibacillus sp. KACC 23026]|uniref:alpha-L-rhamnosidase n=1 Tax=Pullulanibacillus sp. KACC 23026 TaxID=3028315 RepID=UPI0023AEAB02|nr:alpha-L-rhamnosidase [Pullulanibacillus sp. KACC 23026]WEG11058.1 family 78 glycoside hydrolase catalytic domain [Pullulanibacillus sp. KACC 23026]